ncbi:MAG: N-acetyltransferase [Variovorax sp.]|nr:MAG: N-acetyltransferase [Variovorax sp.]
MGWCGMKFAPAKGLGDVRSRTSAFMSWNSAAWRLARPYWGQGFATEAAQAALEFGFETVDLSEIVALTVPGNARSRVVMSKLG